MDQKRRYIVLWMLIAGGVFIIFSGLVLIILNLNSSDALVPTRASGNAIRRVTLGDAKAAFDSGTAVFVDVRDSGSYEEAHIPGALLIPLSDLTSHLDELNPSSWIITYCS